LDSKAAPRRFESCGLPGEILPARHGDVDISRAQLDRVAGAAGRPSSAPIDKTHPPGYRARYRENGKEKNKHADKRTPGSQGGANKAVVIWTIEREGELRTAHIEDTKAKTIHGFVKANVANGSALMTDEDSSFLGLAGEYNVHSVNHSKGEYVRHFIIHTNSIESVWALLKRQIFGIHHWVSDKHLNRYVSEMTWRFNRRDIKTTGRMNDLFTCVEGRLTYKALIG
jgi:transposase-like protein